MTSAACDKSNIERDSSPAARDSSLVVDGGSHTGRDKSHVVDGRSHAARDKSHVEGGRSHAEGGTGDVDSQPRFQCAGLSRIHLKFMDIAASPQAVFATAHIDLTGARGPIFGGLGKAQTASGELRAPSPGLVLWRVIERVEIEKQLESRQISPADDGQSVGYSYTVKGGGGGLFPIDEAGHFKAELVAVFAPPSFLPEVGSVEIVSTSVPADAPKGAKATLSRARAPSPAQLEGRLIRLPDNDDSPVWFVEHGVRRTLVSPTVGRLRFGDGWQRLVQPLPSVADVSLVPEGLPLSVAEAAEGKLVSSWPDPAAFLVENGCKRRIDNPAPIIARFGERWRIKLHHLRRAELDAIADGEAFG